eukprot:gene7710-biopygen18064
MALLEAELCTHHFFQTKVALNAVSFAVFVPPRRCGGRWLSSRVSECQQADLRLKGVTTHNRNRRWCIHLPQLSRWSWPLVAREVGGAPRGQARPGLVAQPSHSTPRDIIMVGGVKMNKYARGHVSQTPCGECCGTMPYRMRKMISARSSGRKSAGIDQRAQPRQENVGIASARSPDKKKCGK